MKIVSYNVNGIRAAARKGMFDWMKSEDPDIVCIQETKAQITNLTGDPQYFPEGYHCFYKDAVKKGYSGVAIYSKVEPDEVITEIGASEFDDEGRFLEARFGNLSVISLYLPSGSSGEHRQQSKDRFLDFFMPKLEAYKASGRDVILCGDWNIAHKEIDLKNWKGNLKNSGFLPHEREWLTTLFDEVGMVDAFRVINQEPDQYTWWSNRGQARANNVGWRIDYHITTPSLADKIVAAEVFKSEWYSDHAPLTLTYDYQLS